MPGLPYKEMPAQQISPGSIIQGQLKREQTALQQEYDTNLKYFQDTARSDEEFWGNVRKLQLKADLRANEIQQKYKSRADGINQVKTMMGQGLFSPETGNRVMMKISGVNLPAQPKPKDWRTEHGRTFAELRRINAILTSKDSKGKPVFPRAYWSKDYAWDKMSSQKQQDLRQFLNAQQILQEQQQELFRQLPRAQQKAFGLQNAVARKSSRFKVTTGQSGHKHFSYNEKRANQLGTLGEKIAIDMPMPEMIKPQKQNLADPLGIR